MTAFVIYDQVSGEILTWGDVPDPASIDHPGTLLLATGNPFQNYVGNGALQTYTADQAAAKAFVPDYPAVWSNTTFSWVDGRDLATARLDQWTIVKAARDATIAGGFAWSSSTFDSDFDSQQRIQGAVQLALLALQASQPFSIVWTLADNSTRALSGADMIALGQELGTFVEANFAQGASLRDAINAATTVEQVKAVTWAPAGY